MNDCPSCGHSLGSNPECPACIRHHVRSETGKDDRKRWSARAPRKGEVWLMKRGKTAPGRLVAKLRLVIRLVRDRYNGEYTRASWGAIFWGAFAITYVVAAIDLVPDFLPLIGLLDDALILGVITKMYVHTLGQYCRSRRLDPGDFGLV